MGGVVALQLHPRDIGKLLIAYAQGVVVDGGGAAGRRAWEGEEKVRMTRRAPKT
jgi:hypothetical protein